ncbi:MAG: cytochrome c maturation protein CcmE [Methylococcales bacterium]|jgi:cytochrome c-type biogenesis protein CcmE|nr:cytochrome c maturation protein CcmE [Methylococcales bacterium]MBT7408624.1 cytochrome c maturation protein CcmE [Methylococcales bacterium]
MTPKRKQRVLIIVLILSGVSGAVGLMLYALQQNVNLFYSPTQISDGEAPIGPLIRVGGLVLAGSVKRATGKTEKLSVTFVLTDNNKQITVQYSGILPDLFREGQGIVALGRLQKDRSILATEVLAKHDENYMPPEVAGTLHKSPSAMHVPSTNQ